MWHARTLSKVDIKSASPKSLLSQAVFFFRVGLWHTDDIDQMWNRNKPPPLPQLIQMIISGWHSTTNQSSSTFFFRLWNHQSTQQSLMYSLVNFYISLGDKLWTKTSMARAFFYNFLLMALIGLLRKGSLTNEHNQNN